MDQHRGLLDAAERLHPDMVEQLSVLVAAESAPGAGPQLASCAAILARWGEAILKRRAERVVVDGLPHLLWPAARQRVLILGHFDTVFPIGTTSSRPFTVRKGVATGPGVCDMKGGIVQLFTALRLLDDTSSVGVLLTCDEETGSVTSRALIEQQARRSAAVLVGEAAMPNGDVKVDRKGGSAYQLIVSGRAAHAGVEPHRGVNATVEVAHQVLTLTGLASAGGTSVTPTLLSAGTTTNTVPDRASLAIDVRAWTGAELERIDRTIRGLGAVLPEATLTVEGGISRYPMSPELAQPLLAIAQDVAAELGLPALSGAHAPGASDGNFTAALGVPTLDGLGAIGGGAHTSDEYIDVERMPERAALLAGLIGRLAGDDPTTRSPIDELR